MRFKKLFPSSLALVATLSLAALASAAVPTVVILGTGGTIQSKGDTRMTRYDYRAGRFDITEIIDLIPQVKDLANLEAEQYTNIGSPSMTPEVWKGLVEKINEKALRSDVSGFVITHGTNTLEETAFFLHLTVQTDKPVVVVGAQRPSTSISADGPMNFYNAVQVAASPDARGKGVFICMNQQINSAREGTKTSAYKVEAFQSRDLGFLGVVDPDGVHFLRAPVRRHTYLSEFDISDISEFPRIDVIPSFADASGDIVDFVVGAGAKGLVLAGHGAGGASPAQGDAFKAAISKGVPVIASSRTGSGRVIESSRMTESGIVAGDNLLPHKARILLMLAVASGKTDREELKRIFDQY
ncbi:asparaginase [Pelagicoccus sp. SDUM812003]|uniref:asparaginase n=1 Tax=Pelagicoccus sp. SDUM812003 TaxID=3041267 RepID=UPI00280D6F92|nr:asparaginase [Pelagicoccus sp. SDUM812003]MDQ8204673.1 asparaginase [Pelagicoccus sp. SDUM812003]